jgi:hypothetical protein
MQQNKEEYEVPVSVALTAKRVPLGGRPHDLVEVFDDARRQSPDRLASTARAPGLQPGCPCCNVKKTTDIVRRGIGRWLGPRDVVQARAHESNRGGPHLAASTARRDLVVSKPSEEPLQNDPQSLAVHRSENAIEVVDTERRLGGAVQPVDGPEVGFLSAVCPGRSRARHPVRSPEPWSTQVVDQHRSSQARRDR